MESETLITKAEQFLEARKYSNNLVDLLEMLDNEEQVVDACEVLQFIFCELLKRRNMFVKESEEDKISEYISWLRNCYESFWSKLLEKIRKNEDGGEAALAALCNLIAIEGKYPIDAQQKGKYYFPQNRLKDIVSGIITADGDISSYISQIDEFTNYIDVVYYIWLILPSILQFVTQPDDDEIQNILSLLQVLLVPNEDELNAAEPNVLLCFSKNKAKFKPNYEEEKKAITLIWNCIVSWKHSEKTYKMSLHILTEHLLCHLQKPVLVMDYLVDSMNIGSSVALLALQGIFILVKDHNLEFPNIYGKLYSLFEPNILHTKHKARLLYLANIFLSSTHLPITMVASFVKRVARLCLNASPQDIRIMITFITNLMIRHPGLKTLINHPTGGDASTDPFNEEELDPMCTKAIESSLWEMRTLQNHILPKISRAACFVNKQLPNVESDLGSILQLTYGDIFEKELKSKIGEVSLTFERPNSLCLPRTNYFETFWTF